MYTRMPFEARNATAHFQRMMDAEITQANLQHKGMQHAHLLDA